MISGIGLCVGGVFLPPLVAPGCVLLGAALAMYQSAYAQESAPRGTTESPPERTEPRERRASSDVTVIHGNVQNNMLFLYSNHHEASSAPQIPAPLNNDPQRHTLTLE